MLGLVIMESLGDGLGDATPSAVTCSHFRKTFLQASTDAIIRCLGDGSLGKTPTWSLKMICLPEAAMEKRTQGMEANRPGSEL